MAGFNWVDVVIVLLFGSALYFGFKLGFFRLLLTFGGFFTGLFVSGWLLPHLLPIHNHTALAVVNGNLVFLIALYAAVKGYEYGKKVHLSLGHSKMRVLESAAGITLSLSSAVVNVWLLGAAIGSLPLVSLSNTVNESFFIQLFDRHFPAAPTVFAGFSTAFDPNIAPEVYVKATPDTSIGASPSAVASAVVKQAGTSVVRVTSFGCGGIVNGSGFVIAPGLVATNAHVIAGVRRPTVKYADRTFAAQPVLFNPNIDFAVLKVPGLTAAPLVLNDTDLANNTAIDIISFPQSIFTISPGQIVQSLPVQGTNIYGLGSVNRNIYIVHTVTTYGSSGGPVIAPDGTVAGMVFAKSTTDPSYAYAMITSDFAADVGNAEQAKTVIGTGACYH